MNTVNVQNKRKNELPTVVMALPSTAPPMLSNANCVRSKRSESSPFLVCACFKCSLSSESPHRDQNRTSQTGLLKNKCTGKNFFPSRVMVISIFFSHRPKSTSSTAHTRFFNLLFLGTKRPKKMHETKTGSRVPIPVFYHFWGGAKHPKKKHETKTGAWWIVLRAEQKLFGVRTPFRFVVRKVRGFERYGSSQGDRLFEIVQLLIQIVMVVHLMQLPWDLSKCFPTAPPSTFEE